MVRVICWNTSGPRCLEVGWVSGSALAIDATGPLAIDATGVPTSMMPPRAASLVLGRAGATVVADFLVPVILPMVCCNRSLVA